MCPIPSATASCEGLPRARPFHLVESGILPFPPPLKYFKLSVMSSIPPKQTPDAQAFDESESGGGMIAMYNAASHASSESFPVLKAFQDYIEAERTQARKRIIQLSVSFVALMVVVVIGFLTAGVFMFRNMSSMQSSMTTMQNKLLDAALASKTAPVPAVQTAAPVLEDSVKQITRATTELQSSLGKKLDGVNEMASQVNEKVSSQDGEISKMRDELRQMQEQSAKLKEELVASRSFHIPRRPPARRRPRFSRPSLCRHRCRPKRPPSRPKRLPLPRPPWLPRRPSPSPRLRFKPRQRCPPPRLRRRRSTRTFLRRPKSLPLRHPALLRPPPPKAWWPSRSRSRPKTSARSHGAC